MQQRRERSVRRSNGRIPVPRDAARPATTHSSAAHWGAERIFPGAFAAAPLGPTESPSNSASQEIPRNAGNEGGVAASLERAAGASVRAWDEARAAGPFFAASACRGPLPPLTTQYS
jgi:hypothetical protein